MSKKYMIDKAGDKRDSHDLLGLEIEQTDEGYQLVVPRRVLATAPLLARTEPPLITFKIPHYNGWEWTLRVDVVEPNKMTGTWWNSDHRSDPDETDSWTASGAQSEAGDDESRSASAY